LPKNIADESHSATGWGIGGSL